jgi:transposase-like protein
LGGFAPPFGRVSGLAELGGTLAACLAKWQATYPKLCGWVEEHIEETLTFYRLPRKAQRSVRRALNAASDHHGQQVSLANSI